MKYKILIVMISTVAGRGVAIHSQTLEYDDKDAAIQAYGIAKDAHYPEMSVNIIQLF